MHRSLKQEDIGRGTLAGTGGLKWGMFRESTGPVDIVLSDTTLNYVNALLHNLYRARCRNDSRSATAVTLLTFEFV
jgi:hypothetical protein